MHEYHMAEHQLSISVHLDKTQLKKLNFKILPLEALRFWLLCPLSCETEGIFEMINELCSPSNSCQQKRSVSMLY